MRLRCGRIRLFGPRADRPGREDRDQQQRADGDGDCRIGDVEDVPAPRSDAEVGEVDDVAQPYPVDEIADRPTEQERQGQRNEPTGPARAVLERDDAGHDAQAHQREQPGRVLEYPEEPAGVVNEVDLQPIAYHGRRRLELVVGYDPGLEQLIADNDRKRDERKDGNRGTALQHLGIRSGIGSSGGRAATGGCNIRRR